MGEIGVEAAYLFRHALLRDAAYGLQVPSERAALHALAFVVLESLAGGTPGPFAADIADHALAARLGDHPGDWHAAEIRWLGIAAAHAQGQFDNLSAARHYSRLASLHPGGSESRVGSLDSAALGFKSAGRTGEALRVFDSAITEAGGRESSPMLSAHLHRSGLRTELGQFAAAKADVELVLARAPALGLSKLHLRARHNHALDQFHDGDAVLAELDDILAAARAADDRSFSAQLLATRGNVQRNLGRLAEAEASLRESIALAGADTNSTIESVSRGYLAHVVAESGKLDDALDLYRQSMRSLRHIGNLRFLGIMGGSLATCLRKLKRLDEARAESDAALALLLEYGAEGDYGHLLPGRAFLLFQQGDAAGAQQALDRAHEIGSRLELPDLVERTADARKQVREYSSATRQEQS